MGAQGHLPRRGVVQLSPKDRGGDQEGGHRGGHIRLSQRDQDIQSSEVRGGIEHL